MTTGQRQSLSRRFNHVTKKLLTNADIIGISSNTPGQRITVRSLWDTGAECSVVSPQISKKLGLIPIGKRQIIGINTTSMADMVKVTVILPERIRVPNLTVLVCNLIPQVDVLIGMDIIASGDFCISNGNGKTLFSFIMPPLPGETDLVQIAQGKGFLK